MRLAKPINFVAFNAGWFSCVLGAGNGMPWLGPAVVTALAIAHLVYHRFRAGIIFFYISAFLLGVIADGALVLGGLLGFPEHAKLIAPLALWMPVMWINFATALNLSLSFFRGRYVLGAAFGLIGAPGTYYAGMHFDAVTLSDPLAVSMGAVGIEWLVAMPLLILLMRVFGTYRPVERTEP
mgnify:CR=1 FL=1